MDMIGPLQLRCMHFIWQTGPCTVHQVHDALNSEKGAQKLAYTTILTVMRNLAKRKMLKQITDQGKAHTFEPLIDHHTYKQGVLAEIRDQYFAGDTKAFVKMVNSL